MTTLLDYYQSGKAAGDDASDREERIEVVAGWAQTITGDVVDIGCSDGRLAARLKGRGRRVIGVDVNGIQLENAAARLDETRSFDITGVWPFSDGSLSAIHMGAVIEHVFDFRNMFGEAARVLKSGGHLWISTPNMACLRHRFEVLTGRMPAWYRNYEHIRPWTVDWLDDQLRSLALRRTRLRGAHIKNSRLHRFISRAFPRLSSVFVAEYRKA